MYVDAETAVRLANERIAVAVRAAEQLREVRAGQSFRSVGDQLRKALAWFGQWRRDCFRVQTN